MYSIKNQFKKLSLLLLLVLSISHPAWAEGKLALFEVEKNIYSIVGDLTNRTPENLGNNATFGFVITKEGVVLIDAGGTYNGAKQIHAMIKKVTDKPIVKVINTGGQDHRWLGNDYFKKLGAEIIASEDAVKDQKARKSFQFLALSNLVGEKEVKLTDPVHANKTFKKELNFKLGDTKFEISHVAQAHTLGDSFVWLPQSKVMFTGDIVYTERMLAVLDFSNSKSWLAAYEAMASHKPKHIIPGHGHPTTLEKAKKDTYDYLVSLRSGVAKFIEDDGDLSEISKVDQSKFDYLSSHEKLTGRNAQQVFTEMEWE